MPLSQSRRADPNAGPLPARVTHLASYPYAHRGLHGNGVPENSRAAFRAAIERGHGIELDVQASREGDAIVFHDWDLSRLTEKIGSVSSMSRPDLQKTYLIGINEVIPTLPEILALVRGRVPILVEVKARGRNVEPLCASVARSLEGYRGAVGVMSFNPRVGYWFDRNAPRVVRGLVVTEQDDTWRSPIDRRLATLWAKPDFLAYDIRNLPSRFAARQRAKGLPVFTWTCRTKADMEQAKLYADQPIYEEPVQA